MALGRSALAEGGDVSAAERVCGMRHATITRWLVRPRAHAQTWHERSFRHLVLPHLQVDELRTRLRRHTQVLWLWVAIEVSARSGSGMAGTCQGCVAKMITDLYTWGYSAD